MAIVLFCRNGHDLSIYDGTIRMGRHTTASITAAINRAEWESRQPRQPFCNECGSPTLDACEHCKSQIKRGKRPSYCGQCGKPFPWTETALVTAAEYTDELEDLSGEDKAVL